MGISQEALVKYCLLGNYLHRTSSWDVAVVVGGGVVVVVVGGGGGSVVVVAVVVQRPDVSGLHLNYEIIVKIVTIIILY